MLATFEERLLLSLDVEKVYAIKYVMAVALKINKFSYLRPEMSVLVGFRDYQINLSNSLQANRSIQIL